MKPSLSLSAAALSLLGTAACGQIDGDQRQPLGVNPDAPVQCAAMPACDQDEQEVARDTEGARVVTLCGVAIYCAPPPVQCEAYPSCDAEETEVPASTAGAREVTLCGATIHCAPTEPVQCAAYPSCGANETEVPGATAGAYEVTLCGTTISCLPAPTEPEECPACGLG